MSCKHWNDEWVAHLYGEMEPEQERLLEEHLEACADCRRTLDQLAESRSLLREACPEVPATPTVVVLRPRRFFQPIWAYAAGVACGVLLFAAGTMLGYVVPGIGSADGAPAIADDFSAGPGAADAVTPQVLPASVQAQIDALQARVAELEGGRPQQPLPYIQEAVLTRGQFDKEIRRLQQNAELKRSRDVEFLLEEITAAELRTGLHLDETRQALAWVALQNNPRIRQR